MQLNIRLTMIGLGLLYLIHGMTTADVAWDAGRGSVNCVKYSPDGSCVISGGDDGTIRIYQAGNGNPIAGWMAHRYNVYSSEHTTPTRVVGVDYLNSGGRIISAGTDGCLKIWNTATHQAVFDLCDDLTFYNHYDNQEIAVDHSGEWFAVVSGFDQTTISLRNSMDGSSVQTISSFYPEVTLSPDRQWIAGWGVGVKLWNCVDGALVHSLWLDSCCFTCAVFSPDDSLLVASYQGNEANSSVLCWKIPECELIYSIPLNNDCVSCLKFTPDGKYFLGGTNNGLIRVWNTVDGSDVRIMERMDRYSGSGDGIGMVQSRLLVNRQPHTTIREETEPSGMAVYSLDVSPDGQTVVACGGDHSIHQWNFSDGKKRWSSNAHTSKVFHIAISPDNQMIATAGNYYYSEVQPFTGEPSSPGVTGMVEVRNSNTTELLFSLSHHQPSAVFAAFDPTQSFLYSADMNGTLKIWNIPTGTLKDTLHANIGLLSGIEVSGHPQVFIGYGTDCQMIWDARSGAILRKPSCHLAVSHDGLAYAEYSRDSGEPIRINKLVDDSLITSLPFNGDVGDMYRMEFSPDDQYLAVSDWSSRIRVFRLSDGFEIFNRRPGWSSYALSISPDSRYLLALGSDGAIALWDLADGSELTCLNLYQHHIPGSLFPVYSVSPDWMYFAMADSSGVITIRSTERECPIVHTIKFDQGYPVSMTWSLDHRMLVAAGEGYHNVRVYDLSSLLVSIDESGSVHHKTIELDNYPNPFSRQTMIRYRLPSPGQVRLTIYDVLGREVKQLVDRDQTDGYHQIGWDGKNMSGDNAPSGLYFYKLEQHNSQLRTGRMLLLR
ncbi:MAG: T9SS type A sorting domain-containing protein [Candidatus Delongbacteria bacterium]|nr:T9SS type A sorting domain-containing protein [Candidatus Delongbacteria bacterium]